MTFSSSFHKILMSLFSFLFFSFLSFFQFYIFRYERVWEFVCSILVHPSLSHRGEEHLGSFILEESKLNPNFLEESKNLSRNLKKTKTKTKNENEL